MARLGTGHFLLALLLTGWVFSAAIDMIIRGRPLSLALVGEALGASVALVALPAAIVVPWRLWQRRSGKPVGASFGVAGLIFLAMAALVLNGALFEVSQ
jgi:hypothetical protein